MSTVVISAEIVFLTAGSRVCIAEEMFAAIVADESADETFAFYKCRRIAGLEGGVALSGKSADNIVSGNCAGGIAVEYAGDAGSDAC